MTKTRNNPLPVFGGFDFVALFRDGEPRIAGPNGEKVTVCWDLDETLRSNVGAGFKANCLTTHVLGGRPATLKKYVAEYNGFEFYKKLGIGGTPSEVDYYFDRFYEPKHEAYPPVAGAVEVLRHLHEREVENFILTSHSQALATSWCKEHGLMPYLTHIEGRIDTEESKTGKFKYLCEDTLHIDPRWTFFIGDMGSDMRAGHAMGAIPIGVTHDRDIRDVLYTCGARVVVDDLTDIPQVLSEIALTGWTSVVPRKKGQV